MNTILKWAIKFGFVNSALKPLTKVWDGAEGYKTQITLALAAGLYAAGLFGALDLETVKPWVDILLATAIPTGLDKLKRVMVLAEQVSSKVEKLRDK